MRLNRRIIPGDGEFSTVGCGSNENGVGLGRRLARVGATNFAVVLALLTGLEFDAELRERGRGERRDQAGKQFE